MCARCRRIEERRARASTKICLCISKHFITPSRALYTRVPHIRVRLASHCYIYINIYTHTTHEYNNKPKDRAAATACAMTVNYEIIQIVFVSEFVCRWSYWRSDAYEILSNFHIHYMCSLLSLLLRHGIHTLVFSQSHKRTTFCI